MPSILCVIVIFKRLSFQLSKTQWVGAMANTTLQKPVALITGAAGGLGQALARHLAASGWSLVVVSRSRSRLSEAFGDAHLQVQADCSLDAGARQMVDALRHHQVVPAAFAHCVGNIRLGALHRMAQADIDSALRANLVSAILSLQAYLTLLHEARQGGAAVLVSSAAAQVGTPNHEVISAAKAGVEGLVRGAAASHAGAGIRVNAVAPGIMDTPAAGHVIGSEPARAAAARQYPIPGIATPCDVVPLMAWLLSDAAARVTGQVWSVDGGFSAIRPLVK